MKDDLLDADFSDLLNSNDEIYEVEADDLEINDNVTAYFIGNYTVQTLYEHR